MGVIFVFLNESMMLLFVCIFFFSTFTDELSWKQHYNLAGVWRDEGSQQVKWIRISQATDGSLVGYEVIKEGNVYVNGKRVLWDLVLQDGGKSYKGKLKPPEENIELSVVIRMKGQNQISLEASKFFIHHTKTFVRETSIK